VLIWVNYASSKDRLTVLHAAEVRLPALEVDISKVEELATKKLDSVVPATAIGIRIETDGSATYECTFFDGEFEDRFVSIKRGCDGSLIVERVSDL